MPVLAPRSSHFGLILPLCTSSASLALSLFQYPIFLPFLTIPGLAGKPLSNYWNSYLAPGVGIITSVALTSTVSGLLCARWLNTHTTLETTNVSTWYTCGAICAATHFAFVPLVAGAIAKIRIDGGKTATADGKDLEERNKRLMRQAVMWHTIRTLTVDLGALLCFAEGVALSFWVI